MDPEEDGFQLLVGYADDVDTTVIEGHKKSLTKILDESWKKTVDVINQIKGGVSDSESAAASYAKGIILEAANVTARDKHASLQGFTCFTFDQDKFDAFTKKGKWEMPLETPSSAACFGRNMHIFNNKFSRASVSIGNSYNSERE